MQKWGIKKKGTVEPHLESYNLFQWLLHKTVSPTEQWFNSSWGYKTTVPLCKGVPAICCFQTIYALSRVFRDRSSRLSSKLHTALLSNQQNREQVAERETFGNTDLALLSFLSIRASILLIQQSLALYFKPHAYRKSVFHRGKKKKEFLSLFWYNVLSPFGP